MKIHSVKGESGGCLNLGGFGERSDEAASGSSQAVFTAVLGDSQSSWPGQPPASAERSRPRPVPGLAGREPLAGSPRGDDSGVPPAEWAAWVLQPSHPFVPGTNSPSSTPNASEADPNTWALLF